MSSSGRLITSADIADLSIVNADVATAAAIVASKLSAGGTANRVIATADGAATAMQQIATAMLVAGAISQSYRADINTSTSSASLVDVAGSSFSVTVAVGDVMLFGFDGVISDTTAGAIIGVNYLIAGANAIAIGMHAPPASQYQSLAMSDVVVVSSGGTFTHKMQFSTNSGTFSLVGRMHVLIVKR